ncbi:MAG: methyltransferase domain-containing protein [Bacteroides sp.]|nr:methyltransferase domain-containing protein [Bacteroides sp.]
MSTEFICPICGNNLIRIERSLKCSENHCFDISSKGYVNLITRGGKKGHGDDRLMVRARRDFLSKGYYEHLKKTIIDELLDKVEADCTLLDSGCGEGYYTSGFYRAFKEKGGGRMYGVDISKEALKLAAKACPEVSFAAASAYFLPFGRESLDIITSLFAPLAAEEFYRTLKSGGCFITAVPLENHLFGLKKAVYDKPYRNKPENTDLKGFKLVKSIEVKKTITIKGTENIKNLFMMTPYYYKTSAADQSKLDDLTELSTETEFLVLTYKKA